MRSEGEQAGEARRPGQSSASARAHAEEGSPAAHGAARFLNRELSWLEFNRRVLAIAQDPRWPLLERVKFLAIASSNLDEFFQIRVALLREQHESGLGHVTPDGRGPEDQLVSIREQVLDMVDVEEELLAKDLLPGLAEHGIHVCTWDELDEGDRAQLSRVFDDTIFPVLTPLAVDTAHPFPYVSNLSFNLAAMVRDPVTHTVRFARIKVPKLLKRFVRLPDRERFVPVEQVIAGHLSRLFPGMEIEAHACFRVTRDADLDIREHEADDLLMAVESGLRRRRLSDAVRLEVDATMPKRTRELLLDELELDEDALYVRKGLMDLVSLFELADIDRPDLKQEPWLPCTHPQLSPVFDESAPQSIFELIREGDILVHHPYDSFHHSVETFLAQAAADPHVLAIKHTIYRSSGPENPIGRTIIKAAEADKQVVTLVELKARFDEQTNIDWARTLEQAGVHVVYGLVGLKTHAKVIMVLRQERDGIQRYCHIGTGNYNPATARLYEDMGLFTVRPEIGADLSELFNHLTGCGQQQPYRKLLVAPDSLRTALVREIRREMEQPDGRVVIKVNALSDPQMIDALYEASQAGVEIDLIVRGICCLRAGVPGLSERIRVRSIVGRFLEHSRIYRFGSEERGYRTYMGSADLMPRNLDGRVEVLVPVEEPAARERVEEALSLLLADDGLAWGLHDSTWKRVDLEGGLRSQDEMARRARERMRPES